jgi:hypothetical protein
VEQTGQLIEKDSPLKKDNMIVITGADEFIPGINLKPTLLPAPPMPVR